jgi:hypothetical protein
MKTHTNYIGDNPDNECTNQEIAIALLDEKVIKGYGRKCCGMNGKNADLDPTGQCVVDQIAIIDPVNSDTLFIEMYLNRYANICIPTDEDEEREKLLQECAENIILMADQYSGEWTGSDYWCFNYTEVLRVPLTVEEYENPDLVVLAERCADAIYQSKEGLEFEGFAKDLNEAIDSLQNLCNTDLAV